MKKRSTFLFVVSILLIIFGSLGLLSSVVMLVMSGSMADLYASYGIELPGTASYLFSIAVALAELAAGIAGVIRFNKQNVLIAGIVYTCLILINILYSCVTAGFSFAYVINLILPVLYLWGWYQSE